MSVEQLVRTIQNAIDTGTPLPLHAANRQVINIQLSGALAVTDFALHGIIPFTGRLVEAWLSFTGAATGTGSVALHKAQSGSSPTAGTPVTEAVDVSSTGDQFALKQMPVIMDATAVAKGDFIGIVDGGSIAGLDSLVVTLVFEVTQW